MTRKTVWLVANLVLLVMLFPSAGNIQAQTFGQTEPPDAVSVSIATDPVLEWNVNMLQAISKATPNGLFHSRWAAIVHASIYDAVASFTNEAEPYAGIRVIPGAGASVDAAVIAAAHFALVRLLPAQQATLDAQYASSLAARGLTPSDPGVDVGQSVAAQILALRAMDGSGSAQFPYTAPGSGNAGVWIPTPPAFAPALLPGWPQVNPWVMRRGSQFRLGPPPDVNSDLYVTDVNEVQNIGAQNSAARTAFQTDVTKWWVPSAVIIWNPVARQVAAAKRLSIFESARLFALLNIAAADAAIACWDTKYAYNLWRPISAIRSANGFGISADPNWIPFLATPPFPEYPSAHNEISGAMAQVLISVFGDKPGVTIIAHSPANPTFDHPWTSFSQGIDEVMNARVWEGIHFRNSDKQGMHGGRCVGQFVVRHALTQHHGEIEAWGKEDEREGRRLDCHGLGKVGGEDDDENEDN